MPDRYDRSVYVTSASAKEIRLTMEAAFDLVNALSEDDAIDAVGTRDLLARHGFTRAAEAPAAEVARVDERMGALLDRFRSLPDGTELDTVEWVNAELAHLSIAPTAVTHDGAPLHIHWTPSSASFDDQVIADILMALAQEVCDHGTRRFGRCAATDCDHLYYDATRNGSRRFCADPRCASRTHTADHRARRRNA